MKTFLFSITCLFFALSLSAQQIQVPEQQYSLITKRTATWCPHCGNWGWTIFENLIADNSSKALLIAAHFSGDLINPTAVALTNNFGGFGQPLFFLNNDNQGVSSGNIAAKRNEIKEAVNDNFSMSPTAQTGMLLEVNNQQLTVFTKTRFFNNSEGDFYVGVYLIEKSVIHNQAGTQNDGNHKFVLRKSVTNDAFGEQIAEGNISAGAEYSFQSSLAVDANFDVINHMVATVIWEYDGEKYNFVNCNFSDVFLDQVVNTDEELLKITDFNISPNPTNGQSTITLELENGFDQAELSVFDAQGKKLTTIFNGQIQAGTTHFILSKENVRHNGLYFLQFKADQKVVTRKVIFQ